MKLHSGLAQLSTLLMVIKSMLVRLTSPGNHQERQDASCTNYSMKPFLPSPSASFIGFNLSINPGFFPVVPVGPVARES